MPFFGSLGANFAALGVTDHDGCLPGAWRAEELPPFGNESWDLRLVRIAEAFSEITQNIAFTSLVLRQFHNFAREKRTPAPIFEQSVAARGAPPMAKHLTLAWVATEAPSDVREQSPMNHARKHKHIGIETFIPENVARRLYFPLSLIHI